MPTITILPNAKHCPQQMILQAKQGDNILKLLLENGIEVEHACEMQCACTTCHIYIRRGYNSLNPVEDKEADLLDQAWGLDMDSRLSCQTQIGTEDLVIEIPQYTLNQVSEQH